MKPLPSDNYYHSGGAMTNFVDKFMQSSVTMVIMEDYKTGLLIGKMILV